MLATSAGRSQTGFFIYPDSVAGKPHVQIIDMKEGKDKKLYIAGESKDVDLHLTFPWYLQVDSKGKKLNQYALQTEVTDIKRIILTADRQLMLYGNTTSGGGKSQPYASLLTESGQPSTINVIAMSYAMILGDAIPFSKEKTLVVQSNRNKQTQLYNLALVKAANDQYIPHGFASFGSEYNEIASEAVLSTKKDIFIAGYRLVGEDILPFVYAIDSAGQKLWEAVPDISPGFTNVRICLDKNENIVVAAGYRDHATGGCSSQLWKISPSGKKIASATLPDIKTNGLLLLKNGQTMIFGAHFQAYDHRIIISKGSFALLNDKLEIVSSDEMRPTDAPDVNLLSDAMYIQPTSSEFNAGLQLSDGRIVLGGRITYPESDDTDHIIGSQYYNQACLLFLNEKGTFRK